MGEADGVRLRELRVLDGPNLYFTRPAIKLTLDVGPWLVLTDERARRLSRRAGIPSVATAGAPGSAIEEAAGRVAGVEPGPPPPGLRPAIPVIAVTGTNGKTTTVRLIAHLARTAGQSVAYTTTDGVYRDDELVEAGDYSGFSGAA